MQSITDADEKHRIRVNLVIPDSGPLITLASATLGNPAMMANDKTYLDVLLCLNVRIGLVDMVLEEVLRVEEKPDVAILRNWISKNQGAIDVVETYIGSSYKRDIAEGRVVRRKHLGELAIDEYLLDFDEFRESQNAAVVVLFEDAKIPSLLDNKKNVHLLSTLGLLETLQLNDMFDMDEFMSSLKRIGATIPGVLVDAPTAMTLENGVETSWVEGLRP